MNSNSTIEDANITSSIVYSPSFLMWIHNISIIFYCIRDIEALVGLLGNSLVVFCVWKFRYLRTNNNILVVSLAVADALMNLGGGLFGTIVYFTATVYPSTTWSAFCMLKEGITMLGIGGNVFSLFLISLDRLISLTFPIWYITTVTSKIMHWFVLVIWLYMTVIVLAIIHYARYAIIQCMAVVFVPRLVYTVTIFVPFMSISMITALIYIRIAHFAWIRSRKQRNQVGIAAPGEKHEQKKKKQLQILQLMGVVLGVYFALYLPGAILSLCPIVNAIWFNALVRFVSLLFCANAIVNPFIYARRSEDFRKAFYKCVGINSKQDDGENKCHKATN